MLRIHGGYQYQFQNVRGFSSQEAFLFNSHFMGRIAFEKSFDSFEGELAIGVDYNKVAYALGDFIDPAYSYAENKEIYRCPIELLIGKKFELDEKLSIKIDGGIIADLFLYYNENQTYSSNGKIVFSTLKWASLISLGNTDIARWGGAPWDSNIFWGLTIKPAMDYAVSDTLSLSVELPIVLYLLDDYGFLLSWRRGPIFRIGVNLGIGIKL
jgi:hypothetical protein